MISVRTRSATVLRNSYLGRETVEWLWFVTLILGPISNLLTLICDFDSEPKKRNFWLWFVILICSVLNVDFDLCIWFWGENGNFLTLIFNQHFAFAVSAGTGQAFWRTHARTCAAREEYAHTNMYVVIVRGTCPRIKGSMHWSVMRGYMRGECV